MVAMSSIDHHSFRAWLPSSPKGSGGNNPKQLYGKRDRPNWTWFDLGANCVICSMGRAVTLHAHVVNAAALD
jgi:hypothetical protein